MSDDKVVITITARTYHNGEIFETGVHNEVSFADLDKVFTNETLQLLRRKVGTSTGGWYLNSVGTFLRKDGWTFPMTDNIDPLGLRYDDDEHMAHHIEELLDHDDDGEWMNSLSKWDARIVKDWVANNGGN